MGSDSDLSVMRGASDILTEFGVPHDVRVLSAHRSPERTAAYVREAPSRGVKVFIAGAGMAAHLAGVVAAHTHLPVIGVPLRSTRGLDGADALYATVMMPPGIPVATVAIGGAKNAAHLAVRMLAMCDDELAAKVEAFRESMDRNIATKNAKLDELGIERYLAERGV
jgi:5-(carboxyamino)imidazole ribonucleotide mutase